MNTDNVLDNTIITGGHFVVTDNLENLNQGTINSFINAVELFVNCRNENKNVGLGLLVNDIGSTCSAQSCSISHVSSAIFELPKIYKQIMLDRGVEIGKLEIYSEKYCRNRGKRLLNKQLRLHNDHIREGAEGYIYQDDDNDVTLMLTRRSTSDPKGTPACPLIMCAYYLEQLKRGYIHSVNYYYVADDNEMNIPNHHVIEKGVFLAKSFFAELDIKNIYLFGHKTLTNFAVRPLNYGVLQ